MNYRKISLQIVSAFLVVVFAFILTSCTHDKCSNVICLNGGYCTSGICYCPVGYEGPQCQTRSVACFQGMYVGYYNCDNDAPLIDTTWVTPDPIKINYVNLTFKHFLPGTLNGMVVNNSGAYSFAIPPDSPANSVRQYAVTLPGYKVLNVHITTTQNRTSVMSRMN